MSLAKALLAVQSDTPALQKNSINPHFRNRYISLDALMERVLPVLNKHGVVLLQHPSQVGGLPALRTQLIHADTGEVAEDTMLLELAKNDPQGQGSAITYARRYSLMSVLGLVADEDDDANGASRARQTSGQGERPAAAVSGVGSAPAAASNGFTFASGKYEGKSLSEVPASYLGWYLESGPRDDVKDAIRAYTGAPKPS